MRNIAQFRNTYGRDPTPTEIYLQHQQGTGGLAMHLANPNQPAWQSMYMTAEGQRKGPDWARRAISGNIPSDLRAQYPGVENLTSAQFMDIWRRKVEGGGGAPMGQGSQAVATAAPGGPTAAPAPAGASAGAPMAPGGPPGAMPPQFAQRPQMAAPDLSPPPFLPMPAFPEPYF